MLPPGTYITFTHTENSIISNVTDYSDPEANALSNSDPGTFDASAFIDPANCDGTGLPLAFHWFITYPKISAITNPYTIAGITGYRKAVLYIKANTMVAQFSPPVDFKLIVTSPETGLSTEVDILSQVTETGLGLPEYNSCRGQAQVGPALRKRRLAAHHRARPLCCPPTRRSNHRNGPCGPKPKGAAWPLDKVIDCAIVALLRHNGGAVGRVQAGARCHNDLPGCVALS